jgi:hypothetical protein
MGAVSLFSWTTPSRRLAKPGCLGNAEALARPTDIQRVFLIAVNIAKLPIMLRQILKDIPRPPNSASRDD